MACNLADNASGRRRSYLRPRAYAALLADEVLGNVDCANYISIDTCIVACSAINDIIAQVVGDDDAVQDDDGDADEKEEAPVQLLLSQVMEALKRMRKIPSDTFQDKLVAIAFSYRCSHSFHH